MKRILLGVTGSSYAPQALELAKKLTANGYAVDAVLTENAARFAAAGDFEAATGRKVYTEFFDGTPAGEGPHLALARDVDFAVVAPATANTIAKLAAGITDNLLTAVLLALDDVPVLLCPAMDTATYRSPITQRNRRELDNLGYYFFGPRITDDGRANLIAVDKILEKIGDMLDPTCWGAYI
ncbi:MAG: phosphopantothenoylcysteine decarboxylase [Oscillospiraceae bacterium]|nr:phosphopantothenoylcysteine decarboxylase [Oscillospiraceae bacterium]